MADNVVAFSDLSVSTPDGHPLISHLSFSLGWGQRLLIEGRSGCGKSTLVRAMRGLSPSTAASSRMPPSSQVQLTPHAHEGLPSHAHCMQAPYRAL